EHLAPQASRTRREKLALIRDAMHRLGATAHLLSTVDDVAWALNLRGSDVAYNPVFLAGKCFSIHSQSTAGVAD
ncbi:MAG: aminopeptidase P family protein, partial [Betaproteobacteria bacterium]|nr:aminopeptidase P family protein [Betaproteobacteria bacterium]